VFAAENNVVVAPLPPNGLLRIFRWDNPATRFAERELSLTKRIVIIGGGIIGLSAAWHCHRRGHQVIVIDRKPPRRDGCSFGNAGMIVPSHFIPLAAPGMMRLGLKWMWNAESPFYIRPRPSWDLLAWLWKFKRSCTSRHVDRAAPLLRDLHLVSRGCFDRLQSELPGGFGLEKNGLLMLFRSDALLAEEIEVAELAQRLNLEAEILDPAATAQLDPNIEMDVRGAVYYPLDCHLSPNRLMSALQSELENRGCEFHWGTEWTGFTKDQNRIRNVRTSSGDFDADEVLICGGIWSPSIARDLDLSLPMQAGKGYSVTLEAPRQQPHLCSILGEARVAVTPMGASLRFGGTMEIAGLDESVTESRVRGIVRSIPEYFPRFQVNDFDDCQPWVGLRPCSPDGLPYVGRTSRWQNVLISTGHAMMGISLAMVSGQITAEIIDDISPKIPNLGLLSPDRYRK
jgi:D-amino-acid dehydrogenase